MHDWTDYFVAYGVLAAAAAFIVFWVRDPRSWLASAAGRLWDTRWSKK